MSETLRAVADDPDEVIAALRELIDALDRRIPDVTRVGERLIREQAAELRAQAVRRIEEISGVRR